MLPRTKMILELALSATPVVEEIISNTTDDSTTTVDEAVLFVNEIGNKFNIVSTNLETECVETESPDATILDTICNLNEQNSLGLLVCNVDNENVFSEKNTTSNDLELVTGAANEDIQSATSLSEEKDTGSPASVAEPLILEATSTALINEGENVQVYENKGEDINGSAHTDVSRPTNGRPKRGRKRKYGNLSREERKTRRNLNAQYVNSNKKVVHGKQFREYLSSCSRKCHLNITVEERKMCYKKFWELGNYNAQTAMLGNLVKEKEVNRHRGAGPSKRNFSRIYLLNNIEVCRPFFCQSLRLSTKRIDTALKKLRSNSILDRRGLAGGHNKITDSQKENVIEHINKFPRYVSHYCRNKTDAKYLPTRVTVSFMYNLYKEEYENCVSFSKYKQIYLTSFNLRRKKLKKDTCNKCDAFDVLKKNAISDDNRQKIIEEHTAHLEMAERAREMLKNDMKDAENNEHLETLTFDLEKTLPLPRLPTNIIFYKRQLWLYNSGVHTGKRNKGFCYVWMEGTAGRGAQEVGSCLRYHILNEPEESVTHLICWSDSCGGQNRNIKITLLLKTILEEHPTLQVITLKYLVPGHSFLPNDTDFSDIETALKFQQRVYTPEDYMKIMMQARKKNPLSVHQMDKSNFFSTADIEKIITNRKQDVNKKKINWFKTRQIQIHKNEPFSIFMSETYEEGTFVKVNIGQKSRVQQTLSSKLKCLRPEGKSITPAKLNDIRSLMHLIPNDCKRFYRGLRADNSNCDDIDGFNGPLDFDVDEEYVVD